MAQVPAPLNVVEALSYSPEEKGMNKLIEGARQALKAAKCDHDLIPQPRPNTGLRQDLFKFYCPKCQCFLYMTEE
jgi:hypothetical protein